MDKELEYYAEQIVDHIVDHIIRPIKIIIHVVKPLNYIHLTFSVYQPKNKQNE